MPPTPTASWRASARASPLPQSKAIRLMADLYNLLNSSWITGQNNTFGTTSPTNPNAAATWLRPTGVINGRMFKMGVQIDF